MKITLLVLIFVLSAGPAFAVGPVEGMWLKLKQDFNSKTYFFNSDINENRTGVKSLFIDELFGEYAFNNAQPLSSAQLATLPEGRFVGLIPFTLAMAGRDRLIKAGKIKSNSLLAIADFSKNSRQRRFYILDVESGTVLINTWVSHATNSDEDEDGVPELFSNVSGSEKSSAGFMTTGVTYTGTYGFSRRLIGLDPALNSNTLARAVVMHGFGGLGAHQASLGNVATSQGCLMFSKNESGLFWGMEDKSMVELVINTMKTGSLIFTYTDLGKTEEQPLIFKSTWIKKTDLPAAEKDTGREVPVEETYDPEEEVVSHSEKPRIRNAPRVNNP